MLSLCPVTSWRKGWAWKLANCFLQSPRRLIRPLGPLWFSHHQVALVVKNPPANAGDLRDEDSIPGLGRSPGEGNSNPLQYSCLENPMDRGAWGAPVHRVAKSWTWLKWLFMHAHTTEDWYPLSRSRWCCGEAPWARTLWRRERAETWRELCLVRVQSNPPWKVTLRTILLPLSFHHPSHFLWHRKKGKV